MIEGKSTWSELTGIYCQTCNREVTELGRDWPATLGPRCECDSPSLSERGIWNLRARLAKRGLQIEALLVAGDDLDNVAGKRDATKLGYYSQSWRETKRLVEQGRVP